MFYSDLAIHLVSCIPDPELALENVSSIFIPLADKHASFKQFRENKSTGVDMLDPFLLQLLLGLRKFESGIRINITMSHRFYTMYFLLAK